jgi:hypothetical protein
MVFFSVVVLTSKMGQGQTRSKRMCCHSNTFDPFNIFPLLGWGVMGERGKDSPQTQLTRSLNISGLMAPPSGLTLQNPKSEQRKVS